MRQHLTSPLRAAFAGFVLAMATSSLAAAADKPAADAETTTDGRVIPIENRNGGLAGSFEIDTAIPEAPGFSIIGVSPTQVFDPSAQRVTFASLIQYLDEDGNLKPGVALGGSPYWWFHRDESLDTYQHSGWSTQVLARTEVSVGYADGKTGKPDRVGLGFHTELLGHADNRLDQVARDCISDANNLIFPTLEAHDAERVKFRRAHPGGSEDVVKQHMDEWDDARRADNFTTNKAVYSKMVAKCYSDATKRYARQDSLTFAGGLALKSLNGKTTTDGGSAWLSYRLPMSLGPNGPNYFTAFFRYDADKTRDIPAGGTQTFNRALGVVALGYEKDSWKVSLQGGYENDDYRGAGPFKDEGYGFYSASVNYKLSDGVWVEFQAGSRNDSISRADKKDSYLVVNLHWAMSQKTSAPED